MTIPASIEAKEVALAAAAAISDKKGFDVVLMDVSELVVVTDVFLIATGTSSRHVKSLIAEVDRALKEDLDRRPLRREGVEHGKWVLLDTATSSSTLSTGDPRLLLARAAVGRRPPHRIRAGTRRGLIRRSLTA